MNSEIQSELPSENRSAQRIESLDLFRGLALLFILVDHIELVTGQLVLSRFTLHRWGLADGLDTFVFISGIVFGIVHRRVQHGSFLRSQWKALRRAAALLAANLIGFIAVLPIIFALQHNSRAIHVMRATDVLSAPVYASIGVATTMRQPFGFDILPLYAVMLLIAPVILRLSRQTAIGALLVSLGLYIISLTVPESLLHTADEKLWSYQPLGWQLVFVLGMLCSRIALESQPRRTLVVVAFLSFFAFTTLSLCGSTLREICMRNDATWLVGRMVPGPLRIVHFATLAICVSAFISMTNRIPKWRLLDGIKLIGRHPLPVFLFGLWFTYVAAFATTNATSLELLLLELNAVMMSLVVAYGANRWHYRDCISATSSSDK